ncbi:MAG: beta-N-acetylglucosaminidase domain-containing protein [Bacilli bacterium]
MRRIFWLILGLVPLSTPLYQVKARPCAASITYEIYPAVHQLHYGDDLVEIPGKIALDFSLDIAQDTRKEAFEVLALKPVVASTKTGFAPFKVVLEVDQAIPYASRLDAYSLEIDAAGISIKGISDRACFYGLQTLREIWTQSSSHLRMLTINDYANSLYRGVIEGLYGVPYNNFEINDMLKFLSYYKANSFFYGPRHDPYFRTSWRELLPADEVVMLQDIVKTAQARKIDLYYGLNPVETRAFTSENYSADLQDFLNKFEQAYQCGVRHFFVSADDVIGETVDPELHVNFMNDLAAWARNKGDCGRIVLTPSCYCGAGATRLGIPLDYLDHFKGQLDADVDLFWTGYDVTSAVSTGEFDVFFQHTGRKPIYWLNWPVNDYMPTRIIMSKGEMLDENYPDEDAPFLGVISNPQVLPYPSYLAIFQCLDYAWNYRDFAVDASHHAAFLRMEKDESDALKHVCSYLANATKYLADDYFEESPLLKGLISQYYEAKNNAQPLTAIKAALVAELTATMDDVDTLLKKASNRKLVKQLQPYLLAVKDTCLTTIDYLHLEDMVKANEVQDLREALEEAQNHRARIATHQAIVLDYVTCDETLKPVEVANVVLTPFLNNIALEIDYEAKLLAGLPTGVIYRGFESIYQGSIADIFDQNENTFMMLEGYAPDQSYLQIDLEEEQEITSLKLVYKNQYGESCYFPNIDISLDGHTFTPLASQNSNLLELDYRDQPVSARFIRLGNFTGATLAWWISLAEIYLNHIPHDAKKVTTSGINGIYQGEIALMFDGDQASYCWFNDYPAAGAYIEIDYRSVQTIAALEIIFKNAYPLDESPCYMPLIEGSVDGVTFSKIADVTSNQFYQEWLDAPLRYRYLRLTNNTAWALSRWVSVAEITLNEVKDQPKLTYTGFSGIYQGTVADVFDDDDHTFLWFASGAEPNGQVTIDYREEKTTNQLRILYYNGLPESSEPYLLDCYLSEVEYSCEGEHWFSLCTGNTANLLELTFTEAITFRYLRLRNGTGVTTPHWVALASVTI